MDFDLKFYLSLFLRRLPLFFAVWAVVAALGLVLAVLIPPTYRSTASILVESAQIDGSTINVSANEQIQIVQQRVMTRENFLDIAARFDVFRRNPEFSPSDIVDAMEGRTELKQLQLGTQRQVRGVRNAVAFTVSFTAGSGPMAARVTNEFVTLILNQNAEDRIDTATSQREFFEQAEIRLNNELTTLEEEISQFKIANQSSLPELLNFNQDQLLALRANLTRVEEEERTLNTQRNQMLRAIENPELIPTEETQISPQERQLATLKAERDTLRLTFSASHPKVRAVEAQIKGLEALVAPEGSEGESPLDRQVTQMELALEQLDSRFLILREQREKLLSEISELETSINATPRVEMSLNVMSRRYDALKREYANNQASLAEAKTGENIEANQKGQRFLVTEQASVPDAPESPNRPLIAAGGIGGGFGLALGLVMLLELLNRTVRRPADLVNGLGLQPFATIPYIKTNHEVRRRRMSIVAMLLLVAIAIPAVLLAIHYYYLPLDFLIERVAKSLGFEALLTMLPQG